VHDHVEILGAIHPDGVLAEDVIVDEDRFIRVGQREPHPEAKAALRLGLAQDGERA
jgi:hypothetical protein